MHTTIVVYPVPPDTQLALFIALAVAYVVIHWAWWMWGNPYFARRWHYRPCDIREREQLREMRRADKCPI